MEQIKLTSSEWNILNCLWERSPRPVMQIANELEQTVGWHRSTTITTLHRMEAKGLVRCEQAETGQSGSRGRAYVPLVDREQAAVAETRSFLDRVYQGSVGTMVNTLADGRGLSEQDLAELAAILEKARGERT